MLPESAATPSRSPVAGFTVCDTSVRAATSRIMRCWTKARSAARARSSRRAVSAAAASVPRAWATASAGSSSVRTASRGTGAPPRIAVPPLSNTLISLVKDTSLCSTILVTELLRKAQEIAAPSFEFFTLYGVAAVYYWVVCLVLSFNQDRLETRLSRYVAA